MKFDDLLSMLTWI